MKSHSEERRIKRKNCPRRLTTLDCETEQGKPISVKTVFLIWSQFTLFVQIGIARDSFVDLALTRGKYWNDEDIGSALSQKATWVPLSRLKTSNFSGFQNLVGGWNKSRKNRMSSHPSNKPEVCRKKVNSLNFLRLFLDDFSAIAPSVWGGLLVRFLLRTGGAITFQKITSPVQA